MKLLIKPAYRFQHFKARKAQRKITPSKLKLSEKGASMVEYALLISLIAFAGVISINFLGNEASGTFSSVGSALGCELTNSGKCK